MPDNPVGVIDQITAGSANTKPIDAVSQTNYAGTTVYLQRVVLGDPASPDSTAYIATNGALRIDGAGGALFDVLCLILAELRVISSQLPQLGSPIVDDPGDLRDGVGVEIH